MAEAVRRAFALAPPEGTVVLAPACSSFDMFRDYAERGAVFTAEVQTARRANDEPHVSSEQSSVSVRRSRSLPLGTQAAPVCEVGVPTPR